jgi:hypothetical protein
VNFAEALGVIFHLVVAMITSVDEEVGRRSKNFGPILGLAVWNFKLTDACDHNLFGTLQESGDILSADLPKQVTCGTSFQASKKAN